MTPLLFLAPFVPLLGIMTLTLVSTVMRSYAARLPEPTTPPLPPAFSSPNFHRHLRQARRKERPWPTPPTPTKRTTTRMRQRRRAERVTPLPRKRQKTDINGSSSSASSLFVKSLRDALPLQQQFAKTSF